MREMSLSTLFMIALSVLNLGPSISFRVIPGVTIAQSCGRGLCVTRPEKMFATPLSAESGKGKEPGSSGGKLKDVLRELALPLVIGAAVLVVAGSHAGSVQSNAAALLESAVTKISGMGTWGYLYFAAVSDIIPLDMCM